MRKAFSIAELMIVVAIIGILAALAMPFFSNQTTQAKASAAKYNLRILRGAIEYYAVRHEGVAPGYALDDASGAASAAVFREQAVAQDGSLRKMPPNPFNNLDTMLVVQNNQEFPAQATGTYGWIYQPLTRTIRLDWRGADEKGMRYFDY
jgi:prepilin-type N-terminal cleavage/methylation domain-containing protein